MKFSMNGFRRNLSDDANSLREITQRIIENDDYDEEDLAEAVNAMITASNVINCVSIPDDPLFTDMSDVEVELIEI